jgi:nicotinamidase/pyrazinamidase
MQLLTARTLLLEIDIQNDFCPSYTLASGEKTGEGALAVKNGDAVIDTLNAVSAALTAKGGRAAATQDWHPANHVSFASSHPGKTAGELLDTDLVKAQALWPDHCVQGSWGAAFHGKLDLKPASLIVRKGFRKDLDSYSAFFENDKKTPTGLEGWLRGLGIETVLLGGLATDYCVLYSALDARRLGFNTILINDACAGVGYPAFSVEKALHDMQAAGVGFATGAEIMEQFI